MGLLPDVVESLSGPQLGRLLMAKRREHHFEAMRLQWFAAFIFEAVRRAVAAGYLDARATMHTRRPPHYAEDLSKALDRVPGYDKSLARKRGVRR